LRSEDALRSCGDWLEGASEARLRLSGGKLQGTLRPQRTQLRSSGRICDLLTPRAPSVQGRASPYMFMQKSSILACFFYMALSRIVY
jgi:hypothetical protein